MTEPRSVWQLLHDRYQHRRYRTPADIAHLIDPRTRNTPALGLIDNTLTQAITTPDSRVIITMPPQEGKSTRVARDFPVWALHHNPDLRIVTGSYAQSLANRNGRAVRNAIQTHPELDITIARDHGAASEWAIQGHHGGLISVGRGAGITGRPADLIIIDDPIKDRKEADSKTIRDTCWDWWTDALASRLAPGASVILIMTRWHQDDLAGRFLNTGDWQLLNIPAQCENPDTDPLGRALGEYMISARGRTTEGWERRKKEAGSRGWAALYQGRPSPADGGILKRDWWRRWTTLPTLDRIIQSWDMTFKSKPGSDYVVGQVWGTKGPDAWLLDQVRGRWGFTETVQQLQQLRAQWPTTTATLIEDKANGSAVIDHLRQTIPGLIPVEPHGGKEARANAVSPLIEAGNIHLPQTRWADDLIEEAAAFPNGTHDDQVDALTQALNWLYTAPTGGIIHAF